MEIKVDTREKQWQYDLLVKTFGDNITFNRIMIKNDNEDISCGDYSSTYVIVEKKTWTDLHMALVEKSKRLESQIDRLSMIDDKIVMFLITGSLKEFVHKMANVEATMIRISNPELSDEDVEKRSFGKASKDADRLLEVVASLSCRYGFLVWRVEDDAEALIEMVKFMVKVEEGKWLVPSRRNPNTLWCRLLRVTPSQWESLKITVGSPLNIATADPAQLERVYRIGKARATDIQQIFHEVE